MQNKNNNNKKDNRPTKGNKKITEVMSGTLNFATYHHKNFTALAAEADVVLDARIGGRSEDPAKTAEAFRERFRGKYKLIPEMGFIPAGTPADVFVSAAGGYIADKVIPALKKGVDILVTGWNYSQMKALANIARLATDTPIRLHWEAKNANGEYKIERQAPMDDDELIELVQSFVTPKAELTPKGRPKKPKNILGMF